MAGRALSLDIQTRDQQTLAALKRVQRELEGVNKEIDRTEANGGNLGKGAEDFAEKMSQARLAAGGLVLGGTVAVLGASTKAAGELAAAQNRVKIVFADSADEVEKFAETATDSLGMSKRAALDASAEFGNLFTQLGVGEEQAAGMSTELVKLVGDLVAFKRADPSAAIESVSAAFRGEYDSLQRFIPSVSNALIEQTALAQSGKSVASELTAAERAQATYTVLTENMGAAAGAAAREHDGMAMSTQRAKAELENSAAEIGEALVPAAAKAAGVVADIASAFGSLPAPLQTTTVAVGGTVLAIGLLAPKIREAIALFKAGRVAVQNWGAANASTMTTMAGAAAGIGALAGAVMLAAMEWKRWGEEGANAADRFVSQFDQANGRTVAGLRQTASEARQFAGALEESTGLIEGLPDPGDLFDIDYNRSIGEAKKAADEKARAFEEAADRIHAAASAAGVTDEQAERILDRQGIDALIMSEDELVSVFKSEEAQAQANSEASGVLANERKKLADATDEASSAAEAYQSAEDGVARAREGVVAARKAVEDGERSLAEARKGVSQAVRGVRDAEEGLASAREAAAEAGRELAAAQLEQITGSDQLRSAQAGVADAERALAEAQQESLAAQQSLNDARKDAAERLEDLRQAVAELPLDEREARLRLAQAQERQSSLESDASGLDRESAALAIARAEIALREALEQAAEKRAELAAQEKLGIEQSAEVVAAKEHIIEAQEREKEAGVALTEAQAAVVTAQEAMATRVAEAQARVADANRAVRDATEGVADAQEGLRAAQQAVIDQQAALTESRAAVKAAEDEVTAALVTQVQARQVLDEALRNNKGALDEQIGSLLTMAGTLDPGSPVRQRIMETAEQLNSLTGRPWTIELQTRLQALDVINNAMAIALSGSGGGGRAIGGRVSPGRVYPVGENGPEFLKLDANQSGRIYTDPQMEAELRRQAAFDERDRRRSQTQQATNQVVNVTVNEAATPHQTAEAITREFARARSTGWVH